MAEIVLTLTDTPAGGVAIHSNFKPAIGAPCSAAQAAALDIMRRTSKEYGLEPPRAVTYHQCTGHTDAIPPTANGDRRFWPVPGHALSEHESTEAIAKLKALPPLQERGR